jgi:hypothetical protein
MKNTGREPATNLVLSGDVFAIPINTTTSEEREAKIIAYRNRCFTPMCRMVLALYSQLMLLLLLGLLEWTRITDLLITISFPGKSSSSL